MGRKLSSPALAAIHIARRRLIVALTFASIFSAPCSGALCPTVEDQLREFCDRVEPIVAEGLDPVTMAMTATLNGKSQVVLPIWPNAAATSTFDYSGPLIGCGSGDWSDFDGKDVAGKVVVMRIECRDRWTRAIELGAKAVVFLADQPFTRSEAESKFLQVPLYAPRFFLDARKWPAEHVRRFLHGTNTLELHSRQSWAEGLRTTWLGTVRGTSGGAGYLIAARTTFRSFVPDLATLPDESGQVLIDLAQWARGKKLPFDLHFAFIDGSQDALAGERELVRLILERRLSVCGVVAIDLTGGSRRVGMFSSGSLYGARPESREVSRHLAASLRDYAIDLQTASGDDPANRFLVDGANEADGKPWKTIAGIPLANSCEPFTLAGIPAVSLATIDDARSSAGVPVGFEIPLQGRLENIAAQRRSTIELLKRAFTRAGVDEGPFRRSLSLKAAVPARSSLVAGFSQVRGRTVTFDPAKSFLPDTAVPGAWVRLRGHQKSFAGVRGDFVAMSDPNGRFRLEGIAPLTAMWYSERAPVSLDAFVTAESGRVGWTGTLATNSGVSFSRSFMLASPVRETPIVLFESADRPVFDATAPLSGAYFESLALLDGETSAPPKNFDIQLPYSRFEPAVAVAFFQSERTLLAVARDKSGTVAAMEPLDGSSHAISRSVRALEWIKRCDSRVAALLPYRLIDRSLIELLESAKNEWARAKRLEENREWAEAASTSRKAEALAFRAHEAVATLVPGSVAGLLMYLALLAPFSAVLERTAIRSRYFAGRVLWGAVIFFVGFALLRLLHPAFLFIRNPAVVFIGFVLASLSAVVSAYVMMRFDQSAFESTAQTTKAGLSSWAIAWSAATGALSKRRLRTSMTILVVATSTFVGMAFTSLAPTWTEVSQTAVEETPSTTVRGPGFAPIDLSSVPLRETDYSPIVWRFAAGDTDGGSLALEFGGRRSEARAILGFSEVGQASLRGWISLPDSIRTALGAETGARVELLGRSWIVVDRRPSQVRMPVDFGATPALTLDDMATETKPPMRFSADQVAMISHRDALELGGTVRELMVSTGDRVRSRVLESTDLPYVEVADGSSNRIRYSLLSRGAGWLGALAVFVIGGFFTFQSLMASALERSTEVGVLSALGLTPSGIGKTFLAESAVFALLGTILGFFVAQAFARLAATANIAPRLVFNFGGASSLIVFLFTVAICGLAAWIPARWAVRAATRTSGAEVEALDSTTCRIVSPVTVQRSEVDQILGLVENWLLEHAHGISRDFVAEGVTRTEVGIGSMVTLAPYELGVRQSVVFSLAPTPLADILAVDVTCVRESGDEASWRRLNGVWAERLKDAALDWHVVRLRQPVSEDGS